MQMQSQQESVLDAFMHRSFGAHYLFRPDKYKKGKALREPADLAWSNGQVVILFYLTSSTKGLQAQSEHNVTQRDGFLRMWKTGATACVLKGKNRYKDSFYVPYKATLTVLTFSITSTNSGVVLFPTTDDNHFSAGIPEKLIEVLSTLGGTVVDLLLIIRSYLSVALGPVEHSDINRYTLLNRISGHYFDTALRQAGQPGLGLGSRFNFEAISANMTRWRLAANEGKTDKGTRDWMSSVFADMALGEYYCLLRGVSETIEKSLPSKFRDNQKFKVFENHHKFIILTSNLYSMTEADIKANFLELAALAAEDGKPVSATAVQYLYADEFMDYRVPPFFLSIGPPPQSQVNLIAAKLLSSKMNSAV